MKLCNHSPLLKISPGTYPQPLLVLLTPARFSMEGAKFQIPVRVIFISVSEQVVLFQIDHVLGGVGSEGHMKHPCQSESWCNVPGKTFQVSHPHWEEEAFHASTQGDQQADQPPQPLAITEQLVPTVSWEDAQ